MDAILICVCVLGGTMLFSNLVIRVFFDDIKTEEKKLLEEIRVLKAEIAELEKRVQ